jgi:hypothetical protein
MPRHTGREGTAPVILKLSTEWSLAVSITVRPLYPRTKSPRRTFSREVSGPYSGRALFFGKDIKHALWGIETWIV